MHGGGGGLRKNLFLSMNGYLVIQVIKWPLLVVACQSDTVNHGATSL